MNQLKSIIKYLKDKGARVNLTGNKGVLVENIARVLLDENVYLFFLPHPHLLTILHSIIFIITLTR